MPVQSTAGLQSFTLVLQNDKRKSYRSFSIFIGLLNALSICLFLYYQPQSQLQRISGIVCFALALTALAFRQSKPRHPFSESGINIVMAMIALYWLWLGYWWAALVIVVLAILYRGVNKTPAVIVTDENIVYPSFPSRTISWNELANVVLKDGLLTIDFRNNRIIQQLTDPVTDPLNEREINEFCRNRIERPSGAA